MKQYLLSVHTVEGQPPMSEEVTEMTSSSSLGSKPIHTSACASRKASSAWRA